MITNYEQLFETVKKAERKTLSVAVAETSTILAALETARQKGIVNSILVGDKNKIKFGFSGVDTMTEEQVTEDELRQPIMLEALVEEIKERAALSNQYKEERDNAKTDVKRKHFHKKLVRNNEESADLIIALERIVEARENNERANAERDVEASSESEESAG